MTKLEYTITQKEDSHGWWLEFLYVNILCNFKIVIEEHHLNNGIFYCRGTFEIIGNEKSKYDTMIQRKLTVKRIERMLFVELKKRVELAEIIVNPTTVVDEEPF